MILVSTVPGWYVYLPRSICSVDFILNMPFGNLFRKHICLCFLLQLEVIKFIASNKPLIAGVKVCERIVTTITILLNSPMAAQVWLKTLFVKFIYHNCSLGFQLAALLYYLIFQFSGLSCDGKHASGSRKCSEHHFRWIK